MDDKTSLPNSLVTPPPISPPQPPVSSTNPVDSARAVRLAFEYLLKVSTSPERYQNFRVEEVRTDENDDYLITLSYDFVGEFAFDKKREYKDFMVEKTGRVVWMKIRNI